MDDLDSIKHKMKHIRPSDITDETFTQEEWAIMNELYHEQQFKHASLKAVKEWINKTMLLPAGLLNEEEKIALVKTVINRLQKHS